MHRCTRSPLRPPLYVLASSLNPSARTLGLKVKSKRTDNTSMTETLDMPNPVSGVVSAITKPGKSTARKLKMGAIMASPLAFMGMLCVVDAQTTAAQEATKCTSAQQAVTVPKPHIWGAGAIMGAADETTALRDVMASTHPDVALTAVIQANPSLELSPMGNVPPTYGGRACLTIPAGSQASKTKPAPGRAEGKAPAP